MTGQGANVMFTLHHLRFMTLHCVVTPKAVMGGQHLFATREESAF